MTNFDWRYFVGGILLGVMIRLYFRVHELSIIKKKVAEQESSRKERVAALYSSSPGDR